MILSIDPGLKPAYVLLDKTQLIPRRHISGRPSLPLVVAVALSFESLRYDRPTRFLFDTYEVDLVIIEGQHGKLSAQKKRSILTLANEAGWQLHRACEAFDATPVIIHPQALKQTDPRGWRDALGCAHIPKNVVQNRVERSLLPAEHALFACASASRLGDCLDAAAIGWGAWIAQPKDWSPPP